MEWINIPSVPFTTKQFNRKLFILAESVGKPIKMLSKSTRQNYLTT